jgi:uncharacterized protein
MRQHSDTPRFWKRKQLTVLALHAPQLNLPPGTFTDDPEITETIIRMRRLSAAHDGLKIVHLSDIHLSLFTPLEEVERAVELANSLQPDAIALTGDYVTFSPTYIWPAARALGKLRARLGTFAVLGNHDFRVSADEMTRALRTQRIRVLRNSHYPFRSGRGTLWLVGVDDPWGTFENMRAALASVPAHDPKILLCHSPLAIGRAARLGIDLMLSGHTHGGQVRLPFIRSFYRAKFGEGFVEGWNRLGETQIYVNRGIGKVVLPVRLACPPEIACLCLRRDSRIPAPRTRRQHVM